MIRERYEDTLGYIRVYMPNHPFCFENGYIYEHRLVMEKYIGRYLLSTEQVHHINKIKTDNDISNLRYYPSCSEHIKQHDPWNKGKKGLQKHTEDWKTFMSNKLKGKNTWMKGRKLSKETRKKMSESRKGEKNHFYGKRHTDEAKRKMSETKRL